MRTIITFLLLCIVCPAHSQPALKKLDKNSLPKSIQYKGVLQTVVQWTDSLGDNIFITTETGEFPSKGKESDYGDAALYAYHYTITKDSAKLITRVYDVIQECEWDLTMHFVPNTFAITDLDKDGTAEIWLMYILSCRSDVSPDQMKLVMLEGGKKYIARGTAKVQVSEKEFDGGEYDFDSAFQRAPAAFRNYAAQLWKKNING